MGADLAVEKPADTTSPTANSLTPYIFQGMLPETTSLDPKVIDNLKPEIPWYDYLLVAAVGAGSLWLVWKIVKEAAAVALPLAVGGELGTAMALERLAHLTGHGAYRDLRARSGDEERATSARANR